MKRDLVYDLLCDLWKKDTAATQAENSDDCITPNSSKTSKSGRNSIVHAVLSSPNSKLIQLFSIIALLSAVVWFVTRTKFHQVPPPTPPRFPTLTSIDKITKIHRKKVFHRDAYEIVVNQFESISERTIKLSNQPTNAPLT